MRRVLIAAPGFRDPFWCEAHNIRPEDEAVKKAAAQEWLRRVGEAWRQGPPITTFTEKSSEPREGPVLSALAAFARLAWVPDTVYLVYANDAAGDMLARYVACQRVVPHRLAHLAGVSGEELPGGVQPAEMDGASVARYGDAYQSVRRALAAIGRAAAKSSDAEVRVLVGPGTPAVNFAMMLFAYDMLPRAALWQSLNPRLAPEGVEEIRRDGTMLPILRVDGDAPKQLEDANRRIQELELELRAANLASPPVSSGPGAGSLTALQEGARSEDFRRTTEAYRAGFVEGRPNVRRAHEVYMEKTGRRITYEAFRKKLGTYGIRKARHQRRADEA